MVKILKGIGKMFLGIFNILSGRWLVRGAFKEGFNKTYKKDEVA